MSQTVIQSSVHTHAQEVNVKVNDSDPKNRLVPWKGLSLRLKATLLAIAVSGLPVIAVGAAAYYDLKESNKQSIEKEDQILAGEVQSHLNQYMWERFGDIKIMSSLDILTDPKLRQATSAAEKSATLDRFIAAYPIYNSIAAFDLKGDPIAQTQGERLQNHSNRSYIQEALQTKGPILSQPTVSISSGLYSIYAAAPIKDKETGEIIGTVRSRIPVARFSDLVKGLQPQKESTFYVINASGQVFSGPEREKPIEEVFPEIGTFRATKKTGSVFTINQSTKAQQFVTYLPPTTLKGLPDLNWSVALATDSEVAFAAQKQQLRILLIGLGLTLAVVITVSIYLINRAIRPLLESAQVVEKLGRGQLDARIPVHGDDELAALGSNINQMADQIQNLLQTMEQNAGQLKTQNDVLSELARHEALVQGNVKAAAVSFTEAIAKTLKLERASIWLYNTDRANLTCLDRYDRSLQEHSDGDLIDTADVLAYFQPLESEPFLEVSNVRSNTALHQLLTDGLLSSGTRALLHLPIQIANRTVGLIQCEHAQIAHNWQADEKTFVAGVASLVAIVLESEFLQQEVSHLLDVVSDVEEGDLTTQAQVSDRATGLVADTFNRLIERFAYVLNQVLAAAHQVSASSNEQKELVESVATNSDEQAQAVNQVLHLTEKVEQAAQGSAGAGQGVQRVAANSGEYASARARGDQCLDSGHHGFTGRHQPDCSTDENAWRVCGSSRSICAKPEPDCICHANPVTQCVTCSSQSLGTA